MRSLVGIWALSAATLSACGSEADGKGTTSSASATVQRSAAPAAPTSAKKPDEMPPVTVDELGPFINGQRAVMKEAGGPDKLKKIVGELPIQGKQVELAVIKKAKLVDVTAVIRELGAAGAPSVKVKAESRGDLPKEIIVVPESKLAGDPASCSVVVFITDKFETDVWSIGGGTAKKHVKGFAGPDLSNAGESIKKDLAKCDSRVAFFTAAEQLEWEIAHLAAGAIRVSDDTKKVESLVLLNEAPVPGRPVKLKK
jgi:biopolymer transport protein ExbD